MIRIEVDRARQIVMVIIHYHAYATLLVQVIFWLLWVRSSHANKGWPTASKDNSQPSRFSPKKLPSIRVLNVSHSAGRGSKVIATRSNKTILLEVKQLSNLLHKSSQSSEGCPSLTSCWNAITVKENDRMAHCSFTAARLDIHHSSVCVVRSRSTGICKTVTAIFSTLETWSVSDDAIRKTAIEI